MSSLTEGILLTDEYQLTMAQVYFRLGLHEKPALFEYFYRKNPDYGQHQAGYCIFAGLNPLLDWMEEAHFGEPELEVLRSQKTRTGKPLFAPDFLEWLGRSNPFDGLTLRAVSEGRVVHPQVPLVAVEGPLLQAQLLETALLNKLNFETLVATKASRIRDVSDHAIILDMGLRRAASGAGNAATRAALIGGADVSSNVGISYELGVQAAGTHAHSLVQAFIALGMSELEAFRAYAEIYPDNTTLLVDTVDVLESGVPNAITVFEELRRKGHKPIGIRLDSGDLAYLSIRSAQLLDVAGFEDVNIVLSSELDELVIWQIQTQIQQEARRYGLDADRIIRRLVYGIGTRLVTSWGQPALGGVYKVVAVQDEGNWKPAIKVSETAEKVLNPGHKQAWRLYDERGLATADLLTLSEEDPQTKSVLTLRHPSDPAKLRRVRLEGTQLEPLHSQVWQGHRQLQSETLGIWRERRQKDVERLDPGVRRLVNPHTYHVSLSPRLWDLKNQMIERLTGEP
ncbi:nicotinate phosphoribosyltransferase [Meiothermus granaticius]|uniref:Nicotinate phosphoribosyltransferase n=1 Tax=Meiothermus granaticius NBRC 107808 TaxID=1227551 RepID=A0A399F2R3_9DEIN|nr:nicotinate phosphoribosyltransferase [Meiothermus granaticius]MCL6525755.1 nicotinate phosphoribosyltransferase [Thermaceae bacterium]RIH90994.1 Nicotinate phosphoribosyltransferase pncB2 [Meiothermus granaticius NBRC 107808]GEM85511.1 nicotinate phosphoribosyltransferase [Meiothermus granaticius NBRC 107808]